MDNAFTLMILFVLLISLSAIFSGTETAFFNLKSYQNIDRKTKKLLSKPRRLLIFLLTGNTIINIAIGSIATIFTINHLYTGENLYDSALLLMQVIIVTLIVLIFGEIIPKTYALKMSKKFASIMSTPVEVFMYLLTPITYVFYIFSLILGKLMPFKKEQAFDSEEELKLLTELVEEEGVIEESESNMIQSVIEFNDKLVKEVLTPRVDIIALDSKSKLDDVMDLIANKKFSKIPVYKDNVDNIKGILYAKDLIPYLIGSRPNINLLKISRTPLFVPETKPIDELLEDFKNKKTNIAIAVDEWGGTSGLITLEDVVEEVMGELQDPYDTEEYHISKDKNKIIVEGSIKIYDLEENIELEFPDEREYDTLAGFILDNLGHIPKEHEVAEYENYLFKVIKVESNRIDKVEIRKKI